MSGAVSALTSMSRMACYGISFSFILDRRSSHNEVYTSTGHHEYRKMYQANVNVSNGTQTHTILVLGREKILRCFVSFIAPSFQEAYSTTFQKSFYETAQFTFCRYLIGGWTVQWYKRKKVWFQYWWNCHFPGVWAENRGPAILFNLGFSTLNVTSEITRLLQQTDCKLCVITPTQRTAG